MKRLNESLKSRGWRISDLAKAAGMPASTVYYLVSGRVKDPRIRLIWAISRATGLTVDELAHDIIERDMETAWQCQ